MLKLIVVALIVPLLAAAAVRWYAGRRRTAVDGDDAGTQDQGDVPSATRIRGGGPSDPAGPV